MIKKIYYFGCINQVGHYLWSSPTSSPSSHNVRIPGLHADFMKYLDSIFTPPVGTAEGIYKLSVIPPVIIIAWNDYSVDSRPASNSTFVFCGYTGSEIDPVLLLQDAAVAFPDVIKRQRQPLTPEKL